MRCARSTTAMAAGLALLATGCGMPSAQRRQIQQLEADASAMGHPEVRYEPSLDPQRAMALGFAPFGLAGFYVKRPGLAVSGILLWPLSIFWTPGMAELTAYDYNYAELRSRVGHLVEQAKASAQAVPRPTTADVLDAIDRLYDEGKISQGERDRMRQRALDRVTE